MNAAAYFFVLLVWQKGVFKNPYSGVSSAPGDAASAQSWWAH